MVQSAQECEILCSAPSLITPIVSCSIDINTNHSKCLSYLIEWCKWTIHLSSVKSVTLVSRTRGTMAFLQPQTQRLPIVWTATSLSSVLQSLWSIWYPRIEVRTHGTLTTWDHFPTRGRSKTREVRLLSQHLWALYIASRPSLSSPMSLLSIGLSNSLADIRANWLGNSKWMADPSRFSLSKGIWLNVSTSQARSSSKQSTPLISRFARLVAVTLQARHRCAILEASRPGAVAAISINLSPRARAATTIPMVELELSRLPEEWKSWACSHRDFPSKAIGVIMRTACLRLMSGLSRACSSLLFLKCPRKVYWTTIKEEFWKTWS